MNSLRKEKGDFPEIVNLLIDSDLLTDKEKSIVTKANSRATASGDNVNFDYFVAKGFVSSYLSDPAILTAQVIGMDLDAYRSYDPLEFTAPTNSAINTFPEDEIPSFVNTAEVDFQTSNIHSGVNGGGMIGKYKQKSYFFKQSYNRRTLISTNSGLVNSERPNTNPCQETLYINLFQESPSLRNSVPRSCVFVTPECVVLIDDIVKQEHLVRPENYDTLKYIESDRVVMMMDALPVENSFSYQPVEQKIDGYINTILEFHRFAATRGISMRDDKPDCYCLDTDIGTLMRYDFGGCVNYNHKLDELPGDLLQNILENIKMGLYSPNDKTTGLGRLGEFDFTKRRTVALNENPKGLLIYLHSNLLSRNNSNPEEIVETFKHVFESLKKAYSMTVEERDAAYQSYSSISELTEHQALELITLLETEMDETRLSKIIDIHKDQINLFLNTQIDTSDMLVVEPSAQINKVESLAQSSQEKNKMFNIEVDSIVDKIREMNRRVHGIDTNTERTMRGIKLIQRWSGCNTLAEFIALTPEQILSRVPEAIKFEDRYETTIILNRLKVLANDKILSID